MSSVPLDASMEMETAQKGIVQEDRFLERRLRCGSL